MHKQDIYQHDPNIVSRKIANEVILVPIRSNVAEMAEIFTLNETGAAIWEKVDGLKTLAEIQQAVMQEFDVDVDELEQDMSQLITGLLEVGALIKVRG